MLTARYGPLIFLFTTAFLNNVHAQCTIDKKSGNPMFPDPTKLYKLTDQYALKVEVNDIQNMRSMYAAEYYSISESTGTGRVDSHFNGEKNSFLYMNDTQEGFMFGVLPGCETTSISQNVKPPYEDFNVYEWNYFDGASKPKFGPFSMLSKAYAERENMQYEGPKTVRGLAANVWKRCADTNLTVRYMLIDETQSKEIYGLGKLAIPLRITVEGSLDKKTINQSYEFIHFQLAINSPTILAIPFNKGCDRLIETEKAEYRDYNFAYEAEIVYTTFFGNDKHIYINNLKAIYDNSSGLFAYTTIPWIAHKDSKFANAGDELFRVFDVRNDYLYEVDLDSNSCNISATTPEESGANLLLPNEGKISLLNPDIINLNNDTAAGYKYLGLGTDRGKSVKVFEKRWEGIPIPLARFMYISTRYYLDDGQEEISATVEKNILLKVVYVENVNGLPTKEIVFNFYHYNTMLTHKPKSFDVSSCFKEQNQTEWFQVIFPLAGTSVSGISAAELQNAYPKIQENFFKVLMLDKIVTPVRIPRILVDSDKDFLYITAALLERVPAKLDFKVESNVRLLEAKIVLKGITTEESCYQACIQNVKCRAINYCGVNCALLNEEYINGTGTDDKRCTLYKRVKNSSQRTMKQVNQIIAERIGTGDFQLIFPDKDGQLHTLSNPEFKQGVAFGLINYKGDGTNKVIDSAFSIFKQGVVINPPTTSPKRSFAECQQECLRESACESFSFCEFTSSCTFSEYHEDGLNELNTAPDDKCMILTRSYLSSFDEYPGIGMSRKAEDELELDNPEKCAKACIDRKIVMCRSFDICIDSGKRKCLLHSTHVIDSKADDVVQTSICAHYSRNYLIDFTVQKGKAIMEGAIQERIFNLPSVEECSKYCMENSNCKTFDFCRKPFQTKSQCFISTTVPREDQTRDDESCSLYTKLDVNAVSEKLLADDDGKEKNVKVVEIIDDTGYSSSLTGGIAFFLFLVGIAIGAAAMFGYGYYKANRRI